MALTSAAGLNKPVVVTGLSLGPPNSRTTRKRANRAGCDPAFTVVGPMDIFRESARARIDRIVVVSTNSGPNHPGAAIAEPGEITKPVELHQGPLRIHEDGADVLAFGSRKNPERSTRFLK